MKKQKAVENGEENCQKGKVNKKRTNDLNIRKMEKTWGKMQQNTKN